MAINEIFPPTYFNYGADIIDGAKDVNQEVEQLVKRYTKGSNYELKAQEARLQRELALAKMDIDAINAEVEKNMRPDPQRLKGHGMLMMGDLQVPTEQDLEESMPELPDKSVSINIVKAAE